MAREVLIKGLKALNIDSKETIVNAFEIYFKELYKWNKTYNLTTITEDIEVINKHFLDSLLYLNLITLSNCTLCDVGTGAGFPGMPIAIIRDDIKVTLVDSSRKKCAFLYHLRHTLGLSNIEIINKPIEQLSHLKFDYVVIRALFRIKEIIKKCSRFLDNQGVIIVSKGEKGYEEVNEIQDDYTHKIIETYIPHTNIKRLLIAITKKSSLNDTC